MENQTTFDQAGSTTHEQGGERITSRIKYSRSYIILLIIILGLGHVLDDYASLAPGMVRSSTINEFFVSTGWMNQDEALQFMNLLGLSTLLLAIVVQFYKSLQDRYGRRIFFIIAIMGMTLGTGLMVATKEFWVFFVGSIVTTFFITNDMQYVYIQEETPSHKRAQFFSYTKILGLAGLMLVPLLRSFTVVEGNENWRPVLYPALIIGAGVFLLSMFFLKETRAYQILKEEREANKARSGKEEEKLSMKAAFQKLRNMPTWGQVKWLIILSVVLIFAILNQRYSEIFIDQAGVSLSDSNIVLTISTIFVGVAYYVNGLITDRIGRRASLVFNSAAVMILLVIEYFAMWAAPDHSAKLLFLVIAGISQGYRIGAFWNLTDVHRMMILENTPTHLRGTVLAITGLIQILILIPATFIVNALIGLFPGNIQLALIVIGIPGCAGAIWGAIFKLKETMHVDITAIEG